MNVFAFCLSMSIKNNKHVNSYQGSQQNTLLITNIDHPESALTNNVYGLPLCDMLITHLGIIK